MVRHRTTTGVLAVALTSAAVFAGGVAADAAPTTGPTIVTINAADLLGNPKPFSAATAQDRADAAAFAQDQVRQGRTVDSAQLRIGSGTDPLTHGRISAVWQGSYQPREFRFASSTGGDAKAAGFGMSMMDDTAVEMADATTGFGFMGAVSTSNMYKYSYGCATAYFDAWYSSTNHTLTTCFEKWAQRATANWIYNRWALFTEAPQKWYETFWPTIDDFTIRSRPWKGLESRVWQLGAWQPTSGGSSCSDVANFDVPIGSAKITVPIHRCESLTAYPDANQHSMGLDWDGSTSSQRYLDMAFALTAANNVVVPVYADYSWAVVNSCTTLGNCTVNEVANLREAGW
jgi:hypothetical protein